MEHSPSSEANRSSAGQEIPPITAFIRALHVSLFWITSIQSMPPPPSNFPKIHFNIIFPSTHSCMKGLIQSWGNCGCFTKWIFLRQVEISNSPKPRARWPPLVGCPRLRIQYIRTYPPYWTPFLRPQPQDAPCSGDADTPNMRTVYLNERKHAY